MSIPPNYKRGNHDKFCGNCGAFEKSDLKSTREQVGFCNMYSMAIKTFNVCDKWYDNHSVSKDSENSDDSPGK